jgi:hypothetical protein
MLAQGTGSQTAPPPPNAPNAPNPEVIREQVRRAIEEAQAGVRDAQEGVRDAQEGVRAAQEHQVIIRNGRPVGPGGGRGRFEGRPETGYARDMGPMIPPQAVDIAQGFFTMCAVMVVGWPLARAFGRRLDRGGQPAAITPGLSEQLQRIEQAVDAMSIEVERISESQRFMAKLQNTPLSEQGALPGRDRR